ncbi:hypothetical protein [Marinomonas atlantica]|uniref:hypothetical protein n=1 Tax=Marinomonas atlantica TaxID=1806668 RepID=UPI0008322FFB|nr:hypothetical protein [Marinomonas atlantica]
MSESINDDTGNWFGRLGGWFDDTLDKAIDGYITIESSKHETSSTQVPASVGVTEPVTQPVQTVTNTPSTVMTTTAAQPVNNQIIQGIDNKHLAIGVGGLVLMVMVLGGRK